VSESIFPIHVYGLRARNSFGHAIIHIMSVPKSRSQCHLAMCVQSHIAVSVFSTVVPLIAIFITVIIIIGRCFLYGIPWDRAYDWVSVVWHSTKYGHVTTMYMLAAFRVHSFCMSDL